MSQKYGVHFINPAVLFYVCVCVARSRVEAHAFEEEKKRTA